MFLGRKNVPVLMSVLFSHPELLTHYLPETDKSGCFSSCRKLLQIIFFSINHKD